MESQDDDPSSVLNWTRALISLRKSSEALWADSRFIPIFNESQPYPMVYLRCNGKETFLIALNPTSERKTLVLDSEIAPYLSALKDVKGAATPLLTTGKATCKRTSKGTTLKLEATSGLIIRL